ncbi:uncharacterized protein LOC122507096 [Leptopilina heterotoma]|uniref:uncharacterized protein LOC122507096 n=1 Tax=Leptopilina heterotoma TaxID=63436 RepID=UPI001CA94688|nr:uncharacterized protein LOC122507096 [Leptopilina heterotoma]
MKVRRDVKKKKIITISGSITTACKIGSECCSRSVEEVHRYRLILHEIGQKKQDTIGSQSAERLQDFCLLRVCQVCSDATLKKQMKIRTSTLLIMMMSLMLLEVEPLSWYQKKHREMRHKKK